MSIIYKPKGRAMEYSPLALNHYRGCDHGCSYCYVPKIFARDRKYNHNVVTERKDVIATLKKEVTKYKNCDEPVLMMFTGDPYCKYNDKKKLTRKVLKLLLANNIRVTILSKGGKRILQDLDLFKQFGDRIKVGASLTFNDNASSLENEPGAALPLERVEALEILKDNDIKTWASIEPVIYPEASLRMIYRTLHCVDEYKVGKLNHIKSNIDWKDFAFRVIKLLRATNKNFYIKKDLMIYLDKNLNDKCH